MNIVTKDQLDIILAGGCQHPRCKHPHNKEIYLTPLCHPESDVQAKYLKGGNLIVECAKCSKEIITVQLR